MNEYLYNHDMCHCNQDKCSKKDECYRYWLGIDLKNHNFQYATFYMPKNEQDLNDCKFFIDKEYYKL